MVTVDSGHWLTTANILNLFLLVLILIVLLSGT